MLYLKQTTIFIIKSNSNMIHINRCQLILGSVTINRCQLILVLVTTYNSLI